MTKKQELRKSNSENLDDNSMGWQVHSPGQGGSADQHLQVPFGEHALHKAAVRSQHASMVDSKTFREHLFHLFVSGALDLKEVVREVHFKKQEKCLRESEGKQQAKGFWALKSNIMFDFRETGGVQQVTATITVTS